MRRALPQWAAGRGAGALPGRPRSAHRGTRCRARRRSAPPAAADAASRRRAGGDPIGSCHRTGSGSARAAEPAARSRTRTHRAAGLLTDPDVRLVVLTGAGGSGKTRLAIEAGRRAAPAFTDGLRYISLAAIREADALAAAIAAALRHIAGHRAGGRGVDHAFAQPRNAADSRQLRAVTRRGAVARHAPGGCAPIDDSCHEPLSCCTCPVNTSFRSTLCRTTRRDGVHRTGHTGQRQARTREVRPRHDRDAVSSPRPAAAGDRACRRPASGADLRRSAGPARHRLPMLVGGPSDLPTRQQTMRSTLAWSFDQLEPQAQGDVAALSVFADGCTLEAAAEVLGSGAETPRRLLELVDHSLLTHSPTSHGSRYAMLETVREFAAEQLEAGGHQEQVRVGMPSTCCGSPSPWGCRSTRSPQAGRNDNELAVAEQANLRAALDWAHDVDPALGLELMAALEQFWISANPPEAARRLEALLERACAASSRRQGPRSTRSRRRDRVRR